MAAATISGATGGGGMRTERSCWNLTAGRAHGHGAKRKTHLGDYDRARTWAERAMAIDPEDLVAHYNIARVYSLLGDAEQTLDLLEKVVPHSSHEQMMWLKNDSDLHPVRDKIELGQAYDNLPSK